LASPSKFIRSSSKGFKMSPLKHTGTTKLDEIVESPLGVNSSPTSPVRKGTKISSPLKIKKKGSTISNWWDYKIPSGVKIKSNGTVNHLIHMYGGIVGMNEKI
jgi:hypothetical protein